MARTNVFAANGGKESVRENPNEQNSEQVVVTVTTPKDGEREFTEERPPERHAGHQLYKQVYKTYRS
jgi:hypothetical protein